MIRLLEVLLHNSSTDGGTGRPNRFKRLCGPLANSPFHHEPDPVNSKLKAAYHKADNAIENIVNLLRAA